MSREIVVRGEEEVAAGFAELAREVTHLEETHRAVIGPLVPEVGARSPIRTGALASSWDLRVDRSGGAISSGLAYAGPLEFGVEGRFGAVRMVRDTLERNEGAILSGYEDAIAERARAIGFRVTR